MSQNAPAAGPARPSRARRTERLLSAALAVESLETRRLLAATLIQDLDPRNASASPASIVTTPGQAFFLTSDAAGGSTTYSLYHTDATDAGTTPLLTSTSPIGNLAAAGGLAYFDAKQAGVSQAWRTDGTPAGTAPLTSFAAAGMTSRNFTEVNGTVFFVASNSVTGGVELWKTGGAIGSTTQVVDASQFASMTSLTNVGGTLFFTAAPKATSADVELWKTDGTAAGTVRVKDIRAGTSGSAPTSLTNVAGTLYLVANGGTFPGLWKSDGTDAGTVLVTSFAGAGQPASPQALTALGSTLYFSAALGSQRYLFKSDGTSAGTGVVAYATPLGSGDNFNPTALTPFGNELYFSASTSTTGLELWKTDGTADGTVRLTDLNPGIGHSFPSGMTVFDGKLYFSALDAVHGQELWRTDGTAGGTTLVSDTYPGPGSGSPSRLAAMAGAAGAPGKLLFTATDALHGTELWSSDGTTAGTGMVKDIATAPLGSSPTMLTAVGNRIFFNALGNLWVSDGVGGHTQSLGVSTIDETGPITAPVSSLADRDKGLPTTVALGDVLYFISGGRLWRSDGTRTGTYQVSSAASKLASLTRVGNLLYFSADDGTAGEELWRSDGTAAGTYRLVDIIPGKSSSAPRHITDVNGVAFFKSWYRVYRSDGTASGTYAITGDINNSDYLDDFQRVGNSLYFHTIGGLWRSDGTAAGTVDLLAGRDVFLGQFTSPRPLGSTLYFVGAGPASEGRVPGLYKTDGTAAGTVLVTTIGTARDSNNQPGYALTVAGNRLFFTGPGGNTLWISDGTAGGTIAVRTFDPAAPATALTAVGNQLYFASGGALFVSDGSVAGTVPVSNTPAPALTGVSGLVAFDGALALVGSHPLYGAEPWLVDSATPPAVPVAPTGLTATAAFAAQIDLSWTDRSAGESGFRVDRSTDPTFATVDASVLLPPGRTYYSDRAPTVGTTFYYRVVAVSRSGESAPATVSATTATGTPRGPSGVVATPDADRAVTLTWADNASDETGYVVQRSTDPTFASVEATYALPANATSYVDTAVTALNRYYYRVYATGTGLASEYAPTFIAMPDRAPAGVQAAGISPSRIDLRWTNPASTTTSVQIQRRRPGDTAWQLAGTLPGTQLEYSDLNLAVTSTWEYRVVGVTAAGLSPSLPITISTTAPVLTTPVKSLPPVVDSRAGSTPTKVVVSNGVGYFVASGKELWRTDGTPAGTSLVRRLDGALGLVDVNGTLYFVGSEYGVNSGIYKSDGTAAGTVLVKDINPLGNAFLHDLVAFNGNLFFRGVRNGSDSDSLWTSDGTPGGTVEVKAFGWRNGGDVYRQMLVSGGRLWLGANAPDSTLPVVYVSDGTAAGTVQVGPPGGYVPSDPYAFFPAGNVVYFLARPAANTLQTWWRSDGTPDGTFTIPNLPLQQAAQARAVGDTLFVPGYRDDIGWELFKVGPTDTAATLVKDVTPGTADSTPHGLTPFRNGLAFFTTDGASVSLYLTDGTAAGTTFVKQLPAAAGATVLETRVFVNALYFLVREPLGAWVLYRSDGTAAGTAEVKRFYGTAQPGGLAEVGGRLTFSADDGVNGLEPWTTDGTPAGTVLLKDLVNTPLPTKPDSMVQFKGAIYFTFTPMSIGTRGPIYRTDGTAAGTTLIYDGQASDLYVAGNLIYFKAFTPEAGVEIWCTDGTAAGTRIVVDLTPGTTWTAWVPLAPLANGLIFGVRGADKQRYELWRTDGTAAGTVKVYNQVLYLDDAYGPQHTPAVLNGVMYFYGEDDTRLGGQLWRTDGTAQGTYQVKAFSVGNSSPNRFAILNGVLYFTAYSDTYHDSLWRSDGTAAGTTLVKADTSAVFLTAANGSLYFGTDAGLWKSDGTPGGTALLSAAATNFSRMIAVGNQAYFFAAGGLWKTDGTAAGTTLVRSVSFAPFQNTTPSQVFMANVGGTLFYSDGYDLWRSDGTFTGTYQVAKIADNSNAQWLMPYSGALAAPLGDLLLFGTMTPDGGRELRTAYVTPPAAPTGLTNSGPAPAAPPDSTSPVLAAATPAGVRLTWADNSANESGFVIERSATPDFAAAVTVTFFVPANTVSYTDTTASPGDAYYYRVRAVNAAGASAPSNGITTPPATLLSADFLYDGPAHRVVLRFSADVAASLSLGDFRLRNLTTGQDVPASQMTLAYDPVTHTATLTFAGGRLADGRYRLTLASGDVLGANGLALDGDANGTAGGDFTLDFFTLAGDANRDGVVNFNDLLLLARNYNKAAVTLADGDFTGDGVVNFNDLLVLARNYNKSLPAAGPATPTSTLDAGALQAAMAIAAPTAPTATTTPAAPPPAKPPAASAKPAQRPAPKPVTPAPIAAKSATAPLRRDGAKAKPVFSTTPVAKPAPKPAPLKVKTVTKPKGR